MSEGPDQDLTVALYQVITARRLAYDSMMWQSPGLGLTAQAFLMTIALSPDTKAVARLLAAILGLAVALLSIQLMSKHRYLESIDSRLAEELETRLGIQDKLGMKPHASAAARSGGRVQPGWLAKHRSFEFWRRGMALFAAADLFVIIVTLAGASAIAR